MNDIEKLTDSVRDLHNILINSYKSNREDANMSILKQMRIIHSKALYELNHCIEKYKPNGTDKEKILPSIYYSYVDVIHSYVRECDILLRRNESEPYKLFQSDMKPIIRTDKGFTEVSLSNFDTPNNFDEIRDVNESFWVNQFKGGNTGQDVLHKKTMSSEWIDNLSGEDVLKFLDIPAKGGAEEEKPILVNYWASWCGPSKAFKPHWDNFVSIAKEKFPNLIVYNVEVGNDQEKIAHSKQMGVERYPSLVLIKGNESIVHEGGMTAEDLVKYVSENTR